MSLADGEYELDVSCLLDGGLDGNFALRYGFIPDSMDQTKPLILYQNEQETLLKASSNDTNGDSMVFEGVTQQIRPSTNSSNEQFYLSYHGDSGESLVVLKKLNSTVRLSKSRNTKGLMSKIASWENEKSASKTTENSNPRLHFPKMSQKSKPASSIESQSSQSKPSKPSKPNKPSTSNKTSTPSPQKMRPQISAKRPPVSVSSTPDISNGDFDELGHEEISFPEFEIAEEKETSKRPPPKEQAVKTEKTAPPPSRKPRPKNSGKTIPKGRTPNESSDVDMDDSFKDLEDQLQEVLEEEEVARPKPETSNNSNNNNNDNISSDDNNNAGQNKVDTSNSITSNIVNDSFDDESDEDDYQFSGNPFVININEGEEVKNVTKDKYTTNKGLKPVSLRDLVDNRKDDDMSSSEEE